MPVPGNALGWASTAIREAEHRVRIGQGNWADADTADMAAVSRGSRRPLLATSAVAVVGTAALLPFARHPLGVSASFLPAMLSVVACFDVLSVYLLVGDFRDRGDRRLLAMAAAYTWSLVVMAGYGCAFPGVVAAHPPLAVTASVAPYLYLAWHAGFPILIGLGWTRWPHAWTAPAPTSRRGVTAAAVVSLAALAGAAVVAGVALTAHQLPVLIHGSDTTRMTTLTAPITIPLVLLALVAAARGTRRRTGPERWSSVVVLVCLCDLTLTYAARHRYSLGWYCGRGLTLLATGVVLMSMLAGFRRLKSQAEHDAAVDPLTGLANRRAAHAALEQLVARSQRTGAPLSVLSLDLDHFKAVNDTYGHDVGDLVLVEFADVLTGSCRLSDTVARFGGEEFLLLLPDTATDGALVVAHRIQQAMRAMITPTSGHRMTASIGAATLQPLETPAELLHRADNALYQAKAAGRDQVRGATSTATEHSITG